MKFNPDVHSVVSDYIANDYSEEEHNALISKCFSIDDIDLSKAKQLCGEFNRSKVGEVFDFELNNGEPYHLDPFGIMDIVKHQVKLRRPGKVQEQIRLRTEYLFPEYNFLESLRYWVVAPALKYKEQEHQIKCRLNGLSGDGSMRDKLKTYLWEEHQYTCFNWASK